LILRSLCKYHTLGWAKKFKNTKLPKNIKKRFVTNNPEINIGKYKKLQKISRASSLISTSCYWVGWLGDRNDIQY
jgi:hypothetical protein